MGTQFGDYKGVTASIDVYQLATNCGTSVQMIEQYYAHARTEDFAKELTKGFLPRAKNSP
jgi:hypothetical protein